MSGDLPRDVLPIADRPVAPSTALDAKDPGATFPPIEPLRPPVGAPNVLIVLLDDVGFGAAGTFGGRSGSIGGNVAPGSLASNAVDGATGRSAMGRTSRRRSPLMLSLHRAGGCLGQWYDSV